MLVQRNRGRAARGHQPPPAVPDLIETFQRVAARYPDRVAIASPDGELSYAELSRRANAVAELLGPYPGVVCVLATHAPATMVGLLGTLLAGGTYCPLDPGFPVARQLEMLAAARSSTVLVTADGQLAPPVPPGVEVLDIRHEPSAAEPPRLPDGPEEPAYLLFTSGSTGMPKPVTTPRTAITATVASLRNLFDLSPEDRVLQFASLNWDTAFEEILPALTTGATLVFDPDAHSGSFHRFLRMLERQRISVVDLPTAYWHELVLHLGEDEAELPASVRTVIIGGEAVSPARLADWKDLRTGHLRLVNTYGCTETTLITHAIDLHGPLAAATDPQDPAVPIGHRLPHVVEHVTDEGELLIGGPAIATGYRGMADATLVKFVRLDLGPASGRFFRTGDRVRARDDGALVHAGRLDDEVKVRGIRVNPTEVEAQLTRCPGVAAAAVLGVTTLGRTTLVAYIVPRTETADSADFVAGVRADLAARVPGHLVPGRIIAVPELVHTASGKVDRRSSHSRYTTALASTTATDLGGH
ncbi:hypothetical protein CS0771_15300 [Catellatospora sp. IY07-71]|uniref:AMP-binding protein n=1 Tax=Catellatospora sp. IY07-71 TaxID=2728827 RepID=UPI001BB3B3CE|nr:AMP-binding protein [Catellatospora sp. IY07-71]BCJ71986.1 hypothetical protein CS0771_15300 [Catellatospora sp. IY07-71]